MERLRLRVGGVSLLAALLVASVAPSTVLRASTAEGGLSEFLVVLKHDPDPGAGDDHRVAGSSFSSAQDAPAVGPSPAPRNANAPSKSSDRPPEIGPAATALAALDETLAVLRAEGAVADVEAFPRLGVIAVVGDAKAREAIAGRTDVTAVAPNERRQLVAVSNTLHPSGTGGPATANGWNEAGPTGSSEPGTATGWNVGAVGAEAAWGEIGASGQGVTIAAIDSGADWTHWALRGSYRGRDGHHNYNWMDFARPDRPSDRPIDELGHGTQVLSIAVGGSREGGGGATRADALGVAPGAEWIAVRTFDRHGFSTDRQLLRAAEWLLAPTKLDGSEPQARMAPDVVNCSWVLENGSDPLYDAVIRAWRDAGILPVFAAGNSDDGTRSAGGVLAPAGNPGVLAVGATNRDGAVWPLSKGGPSFGGDTKPDLVAPGVGVPTALIGGDTVYGTGTSMAAPHVSGAAAIMLSANPGLGVDDLARGLRDAADDIAPPGPDNGSGWGSLDARAAAEWALLAGRVAGTVSDENGDPIEGAAVSIEPHSGAGAAQAEEGRWHSPPDGGAALPADALALGAGLAPVAAASPDGHELSTLFSLVTGGDGTYSAAVSPGAWRVSAIDAEHVSGSSESRVLSELSTITDVRLSSAPMGRVTGRVTGAFDQAVEGATVELAGDVAGSGRALGVSGPDGMYDVRVKTGDQKLAFRADRLRVVTAEVRVQAVTETALDVRMTSVPRALVVDADAYTGERIHRYALEALRSRGIGADVWAVADPSSDLPGAADLAAYDVIIWLHVFGSPGRLDAYRRDSATEALLAGYVADGGRLIVSGQDIARHDSGDDPLESGLAPELVSSTFGARYLADDSGQSTVLGDLWLDGLTLRLDEPGGRDMGPRLAPDVIEPSGSCAPGACQPPLRYAGGRAAAMAVDGPGGRRVYLAFGPECVGDRAALGELYDRLLGWLEAPRLSLAAEPHVVAMGDVARLQAEVAAGRDAARCELEVAVGTDWAIETGSSGISVVDDNLASWSGDVAAGERLSLDIAARLTGPAAGGEPQVVTATLRSRGSVTVVTDTLQAMAPDLSPTSARANPGRIASDGAVEYSLLLENAGPAASVGARSRILLPVGATAITETLTATEGEVLWEPGGTVAQWRGDLAAGEQAKVRLTALVEGVPVPPVERVPVPPVGGAPVPPAGGAPDAPAGGAPIPPAVDAPDPPSGGREGSMSAASSGREHAFAATVDDGRGRIITRTALVLAGGPDLSSSRALPLPTVVTAGRQVDLVLEAVNSGPAAATVAVALDLPPGIELVAPGEVAAAVVAPRAMRTITVPLAILHDAASGPREVRASLDDGALPQRLVTVVAGTTVRRSELDASRTALLPSRVVSGDAVTATVYVANGGDAAVPVSVVDSLPPALVLEPGSAHASSGELTVAPGTVRWDTDASAGGDDYSWASIAAPPDPEDSPGVPAPGPPITEVDAWGPIELTFGVPFYTEVYTRVWVTDDGLLAFGPPDPDRRPTLGPGGPGAPAIAAGWRPEGRGARPSIALGADAATISWPGEASGSARAVTVRQDGAVEMNFGPSSSASEGVVGLRAPDARVLTVPPDDAAAGRGLYFDPPGGWEWLTFGCRLGNALPPNSSVVHTARLTGPGFERALEAGVVANRLSLEGSTLEVSTETPAPGGDLQYRLTVAPQGDVDARGVTVRVQLPATGTVDPASATGGLELAPATGELVWRGRVGAGQTHALAWTVNVPDDVLVGARLIARASLTADGVPRTSLWRAVRVRSTDFSGSGLTADHSVAAEGDVVRFRIQVVNAGPRPSNVELANSLPVALAYVDGSATSSAGAPPVWQALARVVAWSGEVPGRSVVTVRFAAVFDGARQVTNAMWLTDDHGATFADWVTISPATDRLFVPAVTNSADGP